MVIVTCTAIMPPSARLHLGAFVCCQWWRRLLPTIAKRASSPSYPVIFGLRNCIGRSYLNLLWSKLAGGWGAVWVVVVKGVEIAKQESFT